MSKNKLQDWANLGTVIQSVVVVVGVVFAIYQLQLQNEQLKKDQSIETIKLMGDLNISTIGIEFVESQLSPKESRSLVSNFNDLADSFELVDRCIDMNICDQEAVASLFCEELYFYRYYQGRLALVLEDLKEAKAQVIKNEMPDEIVAKSKEYRKLFRKSRHYKEYKEYRNAIKSLSYNESRVFEFEKNCGESGGAD